MNTEVMELINDLVGDNSGITINTNEVIDNYVNTTYASQLNAVDNEDEREKMRNTWKEYYTDGDGRQFIDSEIMNIKVQFSAAKENLNQVSEGTANAVASNAVPAVITVGTATSSPNPVYALMENKSKINTLRSILQTIAICIASLLQSIAKLCMPIPEAVLALIKVLASTKKAVDAIPC